MADVDPTEDRYHIDAPPAPRDGDLCVLKSGDTFAVLDTQGNIIGKGATQQGLYHEGTRYLSQYTLNLGRHSFLPLGASVRSENLVLHVDLTNPDLYLKGTLSIPHGTVHVSRAKVLQPGVFYERIRVTNYGRVPCDVELSLSFSADFCDLFEVRGTTRPRRGEMQRSKVLSDSVTLKYLGLDQQTRMTTIRLCPEPTELSQQDALYRLHLEAKEERVLYITVCCHYEEAVGATPSYEVAYARAYADSQALERRDVSIYSSNEQFNDWMNRSLADVRTMLTQTEDGLYPHAGVPWFCTPFGRDGVITALEMLWVNPDIACGVLKFLARYQASVVDHEQDAEPGKILHEMRLGEMAALREIPFGRYYGSIDSTPLFVMLAGEYYAATGDKATIVQLWPCLQRALEWIDQWGDRDQDGFVEYDRQSDSGLVQQGWKDSFDSVFHADGSSAKGPIALCEVQAYVYAARRHGAVLADLLGFSKQAAELRSRADELREKFHQAFWCEEISMYALALDGAKKQCKVRTSNAGHCLFAGIALPEYAARVAEQLTSDEMFSGWGIRTLSRVEQMYNPMAYHNGSVWPHDNAIIAEGFARYGFVNRAIKVLGAMFDTSLFVDLHRLPELFCGFPRRSQEGPVLYPVACSPQAWAAAAPFLLLKSVLGMRVEADQSRLVFERPAMPLFLDSLVIRNIRVGAHSLDLKLQRYPENVAANVLRRSSESLEVVVVS